MGLFVYNHLTEIMFSLGFQKEQWCAFLSQEKDSESILGELFQRCIRVIAVGGDGTLGTVLSFAAHNHTRVEVGLLPLGTGNDLARAMGIFSQFHDRGVMGCLNRLIRAQTSPFTIWEAKSETTVQPFSAYISIGCDAAILHDFDLRRRKGFFFSHPLINKAYYLKYALKHLGTSFPGTCIEIDNPAFSSTLKNSRFRSLIVSNICSYGGGTQLYNSMQLPQKHLHIFIAYTLTDLLRILILPRLLPEFILKRITYPHYFKATQLNLKIKKVPWQMDGEDIGSPEFTSLSLAPKGLVRLVDLRSGPFRLFNR